MANYHPLDSRYKAPKPSGTEPRVPQHKRAKSWGQANKAEKITDDTKPWRTAGHEDVPAWQKPGPIQDNAGSERRLREKVLLETEQAEMARIPLAASLFGPAATYLKFRAMFRARTATGHSPGMIALQLGGAFVLYFALMQADNMFGINKMLGADLSLSGGSMMQMQTVAPEDGI